MHSGRFISNLLLLVFLASQVTLAQVVTGMISGTVSDSTGAVIPGAAVAVRNMETGIGRTVTTDAAGRYRAPQLGLGSYEVTAEAAGFQTAVRTGITLTVGREAVVDFTLQVGAVAERITVTGEASLIQTTNATVGGLVDEGTMRDLPLLGRSFGDLTAIQPGVVADMEMTATASTAVYSGGAGAVRRSVGGTKPVMSMYLLDGVEISTPSEGMPVASVLGQQLGVDAIREFTLLQSNYGAQYGRAAGGVINAVTQSGTNEFHGSAFEFFRNEKLDATDYFQDPRLSKAPLKRNQFGASLGGPIQRDRTFFFLNYEGIRQSAGTPFVGTSLTPETLAGRISSCPSPLTSCTRAQSITAPQRPVDPNVKILMDVLRPPNGDYRNAGVADRFTIEPWKADENYGILRIDRQLSEKDSLFGRFTKDRSARTQSWDTPILPAGWFGYQVGGYVLAAISETHIFSPTVLNTFRAGFTRRNDHLFYNYTAGGDQFPNAPGLDPRFSLIKGMPLGQFSIPGVSLTSNSGPIGASTSGPAVFVDNTFDYDNSLLINRGRHSITLGGGLKRFRMNELNQPWEVGNLSWRTIEDFLANRPFSLTALIGTHVPGLQRTDVYRGWRQTYGALYIQDDFQVLPNLTLNVGVRWERISSPREVNGKLAVLKDIFNDKDFKLLTKEDPYFTIRDGMKGFLPRFGFAWTPFADRKTVVRGGFGAFTEMPLVYYYQLALEAPPYTKRFNVQQPNLKFPFPFSDPNVVATSGEPLMVPLDHKNTYTLQWTLSLERQLGETFVVKANYLFTRGINLVAIYNPNQHPTIIQDGRHFTPLASRPPNPNFASYRYMAPVSNQHYSAGQLVVEKRLSGGLRFNSSYTWSRNVDNGGGAGIKGAESTAGTGFTMGNGYNRDNDKALAALHVQHNFIFSFTYELPFGSGHRWGSQWRGVLDRVLGGWAINGTNSFRSGSPVNIGGFSQRSRCTAQCSERPDLRPGGSNNPVLDDWTPERYFDPSHFVMQPAGFFGNVGRNTLIRPGVTNWNLALSKDNRLGEGKNLEFRAEFFNFPNHPNFGAPSGGIFRNAAGALSPTVGRITTTAGGMRQIQLGLKLTF